MTRFLLSGLLLLLLSVPAWAVQIVTGTHTGTGADDTDVVISPACQPVAVFHARPTLSDHRAWLSTMSGGLSKLFNTTANLSTTGIKQANSNGYRVGTGASVNTLSTAYRYAAFCDNGNNDIATGSYVGNAGDGVNITISPAFSPEFVLVIPETASTSAIWRGATSHSGDAASQHANLLGDTANLIQQFNADGFQVGSALNASGVTYHYLALKGNALGVATGSFTGDTNDSRDITVGFQPKFMLIKGNSTAEEGAMRNAANSGDESNCDTGAAVPANIIQAFGATTFQVGTDACANENTVTMRWVALADVGGRRPVSPIFFGWLTETWAALWSWLAPQEAYAQ